MHQIQGLSIPHAFLIRKMEDGRVGFKVKKWHSSSGDWCGTNLVGNQWIYLLHEFPSGTPEIISLNLLVTNASLQSVATVTGTNHPSYL